MVIICNRSHNLEPGRMVYICNPSIQENEARGLRVQSHFRLIGYPVSESHKKQNGQGIVCTCVKMSFFLMLKLQSWYTKICEDITWELS